MGAEELTLSFPYFFTDRSEADVVVSSPLNGSFFIESKVSLDASMEDGFEVRLPIPPHAICSISVEGIVLQRSRTLGLTAAQLQTLACRATKAAATERLRGEADLETEICKAHLEHDLACALDNLGGSA